MSTVTLVPRRPEAEEAQVTPPDELSRLAGILAKAVSRARRGTESLALVVSMDDRVPPEAEAPAPRLEADRLAAMLRPEDELVRVGRREFVLVLEGAQAEDAPAVVRRLQADARARCAGGGGRRHHWIGVVPVNGTRGAEETLALLEASLARARTERIDGVDDLLCRFDSARWPATGRSGWPPFRPWLVARPDGRRAPGPGFLPPTEAPPEGG